MSCGMILARRHDHQIGKEHDHVDLREYSRKSRSGTGLGHLAHAKGKAAARVFWRAFWKTTVVAAMSLFLLYAAMHVEDFKRSFTDTLVVVTVIGGYCLTIGFWVGLGVGIFAVAWRWSGGWVIVPIVGALVGAATAVGLAFMILQGIDVRGAGPHGGGDVAVWFMIGVLGFAAAVGAVAGMTLSGAAFFVSAFIRRRRDSR